MTTLRFIPIFEDKEILEACSEYIEIWNNDGLKIIESFKKITGLELQEDRIAVLVYNGISFSGNNKQDAMKLRASYDYNTKKGTLIHELAHRLTFGINHNSSEDEHKFLNLFLYDVWIDIYGENFANMMVDVESSRTEMYKEAWKFALNMNFKQRQIELKSLLKS